MSTTPRKKSRLFRKRNIILGVLLLFFGWFSIDIFLVLNDDPMGDMTIRNQLLKMCEDRQPEGENGWPAFAAFIDEAAQATWDTDSSEAAEDVRIQFVRSPDFLNELEQLLDKPRFVRPWSTDGFPVNEILETSYPVSQLTGCMFDEMVSAASNGDWDHSMQLMRITLRLAEIADHLPTTVAFGSGVHLRSRTLAAMRTNLYSNDVPLEFIAEYSRLTNCISSPDLDYFFDVARLSIHDVIQWLHGTRGYLIPIDGPEYLGSNGNFGSYAVFDPETDSRSIANAIVARWFFATLSENIAIADQCLNLEFAEAELAYPDRWKAPIPPELEMQLAQPKFGVLGFCLWSTKDLIDESDELITDRNATRIMAAIEQYISSNAHPPSTLDDLVPQWLDAIPTDPISGETYGYRVNDDGKNYILYSFGADGVDNDGHTAPYEDEPQYGPGSNYRDCEGVDFPFHP